MTMDVNLTKTTAVILAAGRGTRMKAKHKNKVAFKLGGQPMITRSVANLRQAGVDQIIVVVGFQSESVKKALDGTVDYALQEKQLGTGDALRSALPCLRSEIDSVLSVYGDDSSFYTPSLYQEMVTKRKEHQVPLLFLTIHKDDPTGLGRIVRDSSGKVTKIVEEKNATDEEKKIQEINTGFYCFERKFLEEHIGEIKVNPVSGEYYLTDMVEIALKSGHQVETLFIQDGSIWHGVNNRSDLAKAQKKIDNIIK